MIICEIVLDLLPTYGAFAFNLIVGRSLSTYVGDTVGFFIGIDVAVCGVVYWQMFRARKFDLTRKTANTIAAKSLAQTKAKTIIATKNVIVPVVPLPGGGIHTKGSGNQVSNGK